MIKYQAFLAAALIASQASAASISVEPTTAAPTDPVMVSVTGGQTSGDWVQIVGKDLPMTSLDAGWVYLNGKQTKPNPALSAASLPLRAPSLIGDYEVRLYLNGSRSVAAVAQLQVAAKQQCQAQCPAGPQGPRGEPGAIGPEGPKGNMAQGTPSPGSACAKGDSYYDIDSSGDQSMVSIWVCDNALHWLRLPQFPASPW